MALGPPDLRAERALAQRTSSSPDFGQGGKASLVRAINERALLAALRRRGEASKSELAEIVGLTTNAVGLICNLLQRRGLIEIGEKRAGLRGQPATPLRLAPTGAYSIGVKLGRRTQQSLLVDFAGNVLAARTRQIELPLPREALAIIASDVASLTDALPRGASARLEGVGLAMPYNLESWRRELDIPDRIGEAWTHFDIRAELADLIGRPVFRENDGTAAAVAELFTGQGRTLDDFALIYFGYSIGGGLVLDGHVRSGRSGNAADFGLMPVSASRLSSAPHPGDGRPDILLNRASGLSLMRHLRANGLTICLTSDLDAAMALRPAAVEEWIEDCIEALIRPLFTIGSLLDVQALILDGLLPRALLHRIVEHLRPTMQACAPEARPPPTLIVGNTGRDAVALGAAFLPFVSAYGTDALLESSRARPLAAATTEPPENADAQACP